MKRIVSSILVSIVSISLFASSQQIAWIRVNQAGYLPNDIKVAVYLSTEKGDSMFEVYEALSNKLVLKSFGKLYDSKRWAMACAYRFDFSQIKKAGGYYIVSNGVKSPNFKIGDDVYKGLADYMLVYMRQQRCGDNPYNGVPCHQDDGYIVDHPTRTGEKVDVTGGWHDASDYLQYQTTSATALYHLMFAWQQQKNKSVFKDNFDARGRKGSNGVPDILDEIRWGMDWLVKMNPQDKVMFAQIADDRDHAGFRLPQNDKVDYGWGPGTGRPVYFVTGKPQALGKYLNRTTGVSSVAGKFSSSFALGSEVFKDTDYELSAKLKEKAEQAFKFAEEVPGNTQTACVVSPYFYEEDTYTDDIELAAATFYNLGNEEQWKKRADYWGELEPVTPWMELGRGRHYQFYPFINLGHYYLAKSEDPKVAAKYKEYMRMGLESLKKRAAEDPFIYGVPFLWCSNNLVSAAITQAALYREVTADTTYLEMETALRDWLFGCNPWGTSMIVGYPAAGDYPDSPHSSYTKVNRDLTYGGLVDGPIYRQLFIERAGRSLSKPDTYAVFNNGEAVYHDDIGDYASNEPTMDGTAGLVYYFSMLENKSTPLTEQDAECAIVKVNPNEKMIYFIFSADSMFQGGEKIFKTLKKNKIKGSFFFTGNFLRLAGSPNIIKKIISEGHYVGGHSDKHLLYASWEKREKLLLTKDSIAADLMLNYAELAKFGIKPADAQWYLPPYEYYNRESNGVASSLGLKVINYTPGTATPADYTTPDMKNYKSSNELIEKLFQFEKKEGLNGAIILIHPGIVGERSDKLYDKLDEIILKLRRLGYNFGSLSFD